MRCAAVTPSTTTLPELVRKQLERLGCKVQLGEQLCGLRRMLLTAESATAEPALAALNAATTTALAALTANASAAALASSSALAPAAPAPSCGMFG